ncbi:MAG: Translation initiation factor IF-2 [Candidatus Collierbacteria bacterium GW2011_GWF1_44_12]|uniref:Translation initiation factor IF-2 n=3 Tax=Candidatus Collieribacteriota TaxID=1752725 RepID=A0A0G1J5X2_9BACT|nr:MAG: Translation initiation factor IF-2 [Candidatus Collierbacteria bacterium GW2011_GWF1_44_12]KKT99630.1 MAG: Translation initiation factor IF-2 [Candidatus Collierbacteria bacterium GW2011_GWC2_45_15]
MSDATRTRPPVVTILGHVDHGKTSLLDRIRHAEVAAGEIGGITQAIGAYQIEHQGKKITFIDTPGHAAFSAMRARGGHAADVAILIVAADDSVMPQTRESIDHIRKAGIPFVVAMNKIDLPDANPERIKADLANNGVYVEGYGGNVPMVQISAKTGQGIEDLLEVILLLSELEELTDNAQATPATALVIESSLHSQKGPLATLLVKQGTYHKNDNLFDGIENYGKIRSMIDYAGRSLEVAPPSTPIQIIGFSQVPNVGDIITSTPLQQTPGAVAGVSALEVSVERPNIILKADVQGSLEAIIASIKDEANVLQAAVGMVSETDVQNAVAGKAEIIGFNTKIPSSVAKLAEVEHVKFSNFRIIYQLFDYLKELKQTLTESQAPKLIETGQAKVMKVFNFAGTIVYGCICTSGKINKGDLINGSVATSVKAGGKDVEEVKKDQEFGVVIDPLLDFKPGDIIIFQSLEAKV